METCGEYTSLINEYRLYQNSKGSVTEYTGELQGFFNLKGALVVFAKDLLDAKIRYLEIELSEFEPLKTDKEEYKKFLLKNHAERLNRVYIS